MHWKSQKGESSHCGPPPCSVNDFWEDSWSKRVAVGHNFFSAYWAYQIRENNKTLGSTRQIHLKIDHHARVPRKVFLTSVWWKMKRENSRTAITQIWWFEVSTTFLLVFDELSAQTLERKVCRVLLALQKINHHGGFFIWSFISQKIGEFGAPIERRNNRDFHQSPSDGGK